LAGKALDDLTVVEFAQMASGPMCGKMLWKVTAPAIGLAMVGAGGLVVTKTQIDRRVFFSALR
jgi:crotonobetainyl-CoA:carnitine CoA-transferase CaiB-like acyl-CoA transferase